MSGAAMTLPEQPLRAPDQDGQSLEWPRLVELPGLARQNRSALANVSRDIDSLPLDSLRQTARQELITAARHYTRQYRDVAPDSSGPGDPVYLAGHQPTLFHPGVWFKNFCLDGLARHSNGVAVNLVIDNDLCLSRSIRVPGGSPAEPRTVQIPFDVAPQTGSPAPYESQRLGDPPTFQAFGDSIAEQLKFLVPDPLIRQLWPEVIGIAATTGNPFLAMAAGRHRLESRLGLNTLELPLSQVCGSGSFARFASELLRRHEEFRQVHNQALQDYRRAQRIRSSAHPVPELATDGSWTESPFWVWHQAAPRRRGLRVARAGQQIRLSNGADWQGVCRSAELAEYLMSLPEQGIAIRTRALTTTMYCRLLPGDLFVHGIGGGKYDQLSNRIMERFFGISPPEFAIVTGTWRLPVERPEVSPADLNLVDRRLRELTWHPERHLGASDGPARKLADRKQRLLEQIPPRGQRRTWQQQISQINAALRPAVATIHDRLRAERNRLQNDLGRRRILDSREFAWCLFPPSLADRLRCQRNIP